MGMGWPPNNLEPFKKELSPKGHWPYKARLGSQKAPPARGGMFLGVHVAVWLYQQMHFGGMEGH